MHKSIFFNLVMSLKKQIDYILDANADNYDKMQECFEHCRTVRALIHMSFRSAVMMEYPSELFIFAH